MKTLLDFVNYIEQYENNIAYKFLVDGEVHERSYKRLVKNSKSLASYLVKNGYNKKHIALIGSTSFNWIVTYFGITISGNVVLPIDKMLSIDDICKLLNMGDATTVILSEEFVEYRQKILECSETIKEVICFTDDKYSEMIRTAVIELPVIDKDSLAELIFTSGTTGNGKGVMLSHNNIISNVTAGSTLGFTSEKQGVVLSVLPIHHTFELTVNNLVVLYTGSVICINDSLENILANMKRFQPTHMLVVPMMVEMIYKKIQTAIRDPKQQKKFERGLALSAKLGSKGLHIERRIFSKVHASFGGKLRCLIVGGAAMREDIMEVLMDLGLTVYQGYGMTENAPVISSNSPKSGNKIGTVGRCLPGNKVKIKDGEILVKGPSVMLGYYKNEAATAEVIEDGWLKTGDLGKIDNDGFIYITGRKKNIIILDNGKNVFPEELEEHIAEIDAVKDVMVYEHKGKICAQLLLYPGRDRVMVSKEIQELNANLPTYKKISGITFRTTEFPKTTTLKIKRSLVMKEILENSENEKVYVAPKNDTELRICTAIARVLSVEKVGITDDFFELGGDSLAALEVAAELGIQAQDLYDNSSAEKLSMHLEKTSMEREERVENINELIESKMPVMTDTPRKILLTGATGYLGTHILRELMYENVEVTCLIRNPKKLSTALKYYFPKECDYFKYRVVVGNIEDEKLGINPDDYDELCDRIDTVIHTAANVHHTGHYEEFERTNVRGTENVIQFCKDSNAVLHHTSTASVSGAGTVKQDTPDEIFSEKVLYVGQHYEQNVYIHSKYKAEEKVILARNEGVNSNIYRIGNLTWRYSDGGFQKNAHDNGFVRRCHGLMKVGAYCEELNQFPIDFTPVDLCARAYVCLVMDGEMNRIYHMLNTNFCYVSELKNKMKCNLVSKAEFERRMMSKMPDKDVAVLSFYNAIATASANIEMDNTFTIEKLRSLGFRWPKIKLSYLRYLLRL